MAMHGIGGFGGDAIGVVEKAGYDVASNDRVNDHSTSSASADHLPLYSHLLSVYSPLMVSSSTVTPCSLATCTLYIPQAPTLFPRCHSSEPIQYASRQAEAAAP